MFFIFFSHVIHLLQFLDVIYFQSYKYYYCQALDWFLYLSIDWTLLQLSSRCVQKFSRDQLFSQFFQRLILYYIILRKCWNHFTRNCRNQCLFLFHLIFSHIIADTWLTSYNLSELHEYVYDLYQTHEYSEISVSF